MILIILQVLAIAIVIVQLIRFIKADADLNLLLYEKFGKSISSLSNQVIWITGASSGIGEQLCYTIAECTNNVKFILSARRQNELDRVKAACISLGCKEENIMTLTFDVGDITVHQDCVQKVIDKYGKIDILINNAGRSQRSLALETSVEVNKSIMDLNYVGTMSLTKAALEPMTKVGKGHIAYVSSMSGKIGTPVASGYSASKHALQGYFDTLRCELSVDYKIDVTSICPGPVVSNIASQSYRETLDTQFDSSIQDNSEKMSTERCAKLTAIAIANRLYEVWIAEHPVLLFSYMSQFMPTISKWIIKKLSVTRIKAFREGNVDHANIKSMVINYLFGRSKDGKKNK